MELGIWCNKAKTVCLTMRRNNFLRFFFGLETVQWVLSYLIRIVLTFLIERRSDSLIHHVSFSIAICCILVAHQSVSYHNVWLVDVLVAIPCEVVGTLEVFISVLPYELVFSWRGRYLRGKLMWHIPLNILNVFMLCPLLYCPAQSGVLSGRLPFWWGLLHWGHILLLQRGVIFQEKPHQFLQLLLDQGLLALTSKTSVSDSLVNPFQNYAL